MNGLFDQPGTPVSLNLLFKGERAYLHGTDMVDALAAIAPGLIEISLRIQKVAEHPLAAVLLSGESADYGEVVATVRASRDGQKINIALVENRSAPPPGRYEYDEDDVVGQATIGNEEQIAEMSWNDRYSSIEQIVTLHKALLTQCFAASGARWYFSRLDVPRFPSAFAKLSLAVTQALGTSLVRSGIAIDGQPFGNIYFSGVKK
jgi:hypothetical protein